MKNRNILLIIVGLFSLIFAIAISIERFSLASSDGSDPNPPPLPGDTPPEEETEGESGGEFEAEIEYRHDLLNGKDMFLKVQVHPAAGEWPDLLGGYVETTISCVVRIRGVSTPTSCQTVDSRRSRPLIEVRRERQRWDTLLEYKWSILKLHKKLKLRNPVLVSDGIVECDVFFHLGGAWHDLSVSLVHDEHARMPIEGQKWNWGSLNVDFSPISE